MKDSHFWSAGALLVLVGAFASACNILGVPMDRPSPHAVYLRDASGDCVALFSYRAETMKASMQHVNRELCDVPRPPK